MAARRRKREEPEEEFQDVPVSIMYNADTGMVVMDFSRVLDLAPSRDDAIGLIARELLAAVGRMSPILPHD